jgi:hypothetical protein
MSINLDKISTTEDLKKVLKFLDEQGFGYISEWDLHQKKIIDVINKSNPLNVKYDDKLKSNLIGLKDYDIATQKAKEFFSKFNVDDKILELVSKFYIQSDDECRTPYNRPDHKSIVEWFEFKTKYNLKDADYGSSKFINYYNLDKNFLKIHFGEYSTYDFNKLYELIFNEETKEYSSKKGDWQDLGKIQIKFFLKGGANIKGELDKYKYYYYQYIKNTNSNNIIKYNNKIEIFNKAIDY